MNTAATDWSALVDEAGIAALAGDFQTKMRSKMAEHTALGVAHGRGGVVAYTQANHDALINLFTLQAMLLASLKQITRNLHERVHAMEAAANTKAQLQYRGVFRAGEEYDSGSFVTYDGSMWHANAKTAAKPGDGSTDWTLCVKRGAHGKDLTKGDR